MREGNNKIVEGDQLGRMTLPSMCSSINMYNHDGNYLCIIQNIVWMCKLTPINMIYFSISVHNLATTLKTIKQGKVQSAVKRKY